jgi:hypothetical protein
VSLPVLTQRPSPYVDAETYSASITNDGAFPRQLLLARRLAQFDGIQGVSRSGKRRVLLRKALDTSIKLRVASLTLTLKYPQNSYAEPRPRVFNTGCCRHHRGFELATVVLMLVE